MTLKARACLLLALLMMHSPASAQTVPDVGIDPPPPPTEPSIPVPAQPPKVKATPKRTNAASVQPQRLRPGKRLKGPLPVPPPHILVAMVRGLMAGLNQANYTENYSVLRGLATPALQARISSAALKNAFAKLRALNIDLSPSLAIQPVFTSAPIVTNEGELRLRGSFALKPTPVTFQMVFHAIDGVWLYDALSVAALSASAAAPAPAPAPAPGIAADVPLPAPKPTKGTR